MINHIFYPLQKNCFIIQYVDNEIYTKAIFSFDFTIKYMFLSLSYNFKKY